MPEARPHTLIAFDFGLRRIGIAAADTVTASPAPRPAITVLGDGPDWHRIEREIRSLQPRLLVVGIPYNEDGSASTLAAAARSFGAALESRFGLKVHYVDERFSSLEASARLADSRRRGERGRRVRREHVDSAAAAIILERWLAGEGRPVER
jgi:putative Holliday junction resolvase